MQKRKERKSNENSCRSFGLERQTDVDIENRNIKKEEIANSTRSATSPKFATKLATVGTTTRRLLRCHRSAAGY